jgi:hypothetical protein
MRSCPRQVEIDWSLIPGAWGDLADRPACLDQVQDLAAQLRVVACHSPLGLSGTESNNTTPPNRGQTTVSTRPGQLHVGSKFC